MKKLILGDCVNEIKNLESNSIDLCIADPPYGNLLKEDWDKIGNYKKFSEVWLNQIKRVLKDDGSIYVWCSIGPKSSSLLDIANILRTDWIFQDMIVWNKQRGRGNRKGWLFTREEILWATKTKDYKWYKDYQYSTVKYHESWIKRLGKENNPYKRATNVWSDIEEVSIEMARESGGRGKRELQHPAQKPVVAMKRIILAHTIENDTILDPFMGSSPVGLACEELNRNYIGIEKDEKYYELCKKKLLK